MNWKPIRKIAAQMWLAAAGNGAVAGLIATGTINDWKTLAYTAGGSIITIIVGYWTKGSTAS